MKNYSLSGAQRVCHEHFVESCFEAEIRLGFRFKHPKPGVMPTIFNFNSTQSHVQQERNERAQKRTKRRQDLLNQVVRRQFIFRGYNKMAKKGREIKVLPIRYDLCQVPITRINRTQRIWAHPQPCSGIFFLSIQLYTCIIYSILSDHCGRTSFYLFMWSAWISKA